MSSANDLTRLVPGFDFLQSLMKTGGSAVPGIGQWIAPTLEPEELQRRIDELRTVQFWLEQNAKLIGTTIQALEVQRMTLATLKGMNLPLADLTQSLLAGTAGPAAAGRAAPAPAGARSAPASAPAPAAKAAPAGNGKAASAKAAAAGAIDPLQWWGALTQQFTELATQAMKDGSAEVARNLAGAAVKQGLETASSSIERAMSMSGQAVGVMAKASAGASTAAAKVMQRAGPQARNGGGAAAATPPGAAGAPAKAATARNSATSATSAKGAKGAPKAKGAEGAAGASASPDAALPRSVPRRRKA